MRVQVTVKVMQYCIIPENGSFRYSPAEENKSERHHVSIISCTSSLWQNLKEKGESRYCIVKLSLFGRLHLPFDSRFTIKTGASVFKPLLIRRGEKQANGLSSFICQFIL